MYAGSDTRGWEGNIRSYFAAEEDSPGRRTAAGNQEQDDKSPHLHKGKCESDPYLNPDSGIYCATDISHQDERQPHVSHTKERREERVNGFVVQNIISLDQRMDGDRSGNTTRKEG